MKAKTTESQHFSILDGHSYKQRTKSSSALSSSGGRTRLSSVNDNLFLENGEKSPSLGVDSNVFE